MSIEPVPCDADCLSALRLGDDRALDALLSRWQQPLFAFAWRYVHNTADAQDLVAETFVRLYHHREKLRPDTRLSAWLFTTLTNLCHNQHRWHRRHPNVSLDESPEAGGPSGIEHLASKEPSPSDQLELNERQTALRRAIHELPHDMKSALLLHYYEQLSYREIATILGGAERGIETKIYRAKQRLREKLNPWLADALPLEKL